MTDISKMERDCPYLTFGQTFPWCICTDPEDDGFDCQLGGKAKECWLKWEAQIVDERKEEV